MKQLVLKAITFLQLVCVIALVLGGWDAFLYWQQNGEQPIKRAAQSLVVDAPTNHYVEVSGGLREVTNTYEVSITSGQPTEYYVPVVVQAGDEPQLTYLIKQTDEPSITDLFGEVHERGYLVSRHLPVDLEQAFRHQYHFSGRLLVLEADYLPMPVHGKLLVLLLPMVLLLIAVAARSICLNGRHWAWYDGYV
ncbi:hypothetical protein ACFSJ3_14945 [Corallincola platygyrae]|uniref:DUF3592 domain-containing protein n=1 Tax=Corallincola platygyrae TaxID=1193278 RepID=A0ABW4XQN6_9GAMM